jgi:hypothetical protein
MMERFFSFIVMAGLCSGVVTGVVAAEQVARPTVHLTSRVASDGDFLTLPVTIGDQSYVFLVDTGTRTTGLDERLCRQFQLRPANQDATATRDNSSRFYLPPELVVRGTDVGAIPFPEDSPIVSMDLRDIRKGTSFAVEGILGMDFLKPYALRIDLSNSVLQLLDPSNLQEEKHAARLNMKLSEGIPFVEIGLRGTAEWAIIATGTLLSATIRDNLYRALVQRDYVKEQMIEVKVGDVEGYAPMDAGWLHELRLGPFSHRSLLVHQRNTTKLGLYYWRRYRCTFDFVGNTVYLQRGPQFDLRDDSDHAGLWVAEAAGPGGGRRVEYVALRSEADLLGIRPGDILLSIDGHDVTNDSPQHVFRQLSFRTSHRRLILRREGKEFPVTIPATQGQPDPDL